MIAWIALVIAVIALIWVVAHSGLPTRSDRRNPANPAAHESYWFGQDVAPTTTVH